jgi:hypothetical protein
MPRDKRLERLARLIGVPIAELRFGTKAGKGARMLLPLARLAADEETMLDEYRQLPDYARKMVRARIMELLEEFGPASEKNPYGKGSTQ